MHLNNIRPNFSFMDEIAQRQFFLTYYDKRANDFTNAAMVTVKVRAPRGEKVVKEKTLKLTPEQLAMMKLLGLT